MTRFEARVETTFQRLAAFELADIVGRCEYCTLDYSAHPHQDCPLTYTSENN